MQHWGKEAKMKIVIATCLFLLAILSLLPLWFNDCAWAIPDGIRGDPQALKRYFHQLARIVPFPQYMDEWHELTPEEERAIRELEQAENEEQNRRMRKEWEQDEKRQQALLELAGNEDTAYLAAFFNSTLFDTSTDLDVVYATHLNILYHVNALRTDPAVLEMQVQYAVWDQIVQLEQAEREARLQYLDQQSTLRKARYDATKASREFIRQAEADGVWTDEELEEYGRLHDHESEVWQFTPEEEAQMAKYDELRNSVIDEIRIAAYNFGGLSFEQVQTRMQYLHYQQMVFGASPIPYFEHFTFTGMMADQVDEDMAAARELKIYAENIMVTAQIYMARDDITDQQRAIANQVYQTASLALFSAEDAIAHDFAMVLMASSADFALLGLGKPIQVVSSRISGGIRGLWGRLFSKTPKSAPPPAGGTSSPSTSTAGEAGNVATKGGKTPPSAGGSTPRGGAASGAGAASKVANMTKVQIQAEIRALDAAAERGFLSRTQVIRKADLLIEWNRRLSQIQAEFGVIPKEWAFGGQHSGWLVTPGAAAGVESGAASVITGQGGRGAAGATKGFSGVLRPPGSSGSSQAWGGQWYNNPSAVARPTTVMLGRGNASGTVPFDQITRTSAATTQFSKVEFSSIIHAPGNVTSNSFPHYITQFFSRSFFIGVGTQVFVIDYPPNEAKKVENLIADSRNVTFFEPNVGRMKQKQEVDPYFESKETWGQDYDDQWALKQIGFTNDEQSAWKLVSNKAAPVVVAVIDSGLDWNHKDMSQRNLWWNEDEIPANGIDDDHNGYVDDIIGWNFVRNNRLPWDRDGHGSMVTGIIGANRDNGTGIAGINSRVRIMVLKALDDTGYTRASYIAEAIVYAANNGARVINLSSGGKTLTRTEQKAIDYAHSKGVLVVVAAGNEGSDVSGFGPAGSNHVLTVAATDLDRKRAAFSNWGRLVDIAAPGIDILSLRARRTDLMLDATEQNYTPEGNIVGTDKRYYRASGTSFSAPFVTGVASLLLANNPELTVEQVTRMILMSADDIETPGWDQLTGHGLLNARKALTADPDYYTIARIDKIAPAQKDGKLVIEVYGTAESSEFKGAWVELGFGGKPKKWKKVGEKIRKEVKEGLLTEIPTKVFKKRGKWSVRLMVKTKKHGTRDAWESLNIE